MRPIFELMKERGIIANEMFTLCLGKNGGYFQLGGYDGQGHLGSNVTWIPMWETLSYKFSLSGVAMNNHRIAGTEEFSIGVIDSGTTFTYVPIKLFSMLVSHFDWFCALNTTVHCKGKRITTDTSLICFEYDENLYPEGPRKYFLSYPVINFLTTDVDGNKFPLKWYPSEYLYREKANKYCMGIERFSRPNEILLGGTFMRQNAFIFDVE